MLSVTTKTIMLSVVVLDVVVVIVAASAQHLIFNTWLEMSNAKVVNSHPKHFLGGFWQNTLQKTWDQIKFVLTAVSELIHKHYRYLDKSMNVMRLFKRIFMNCYPIAHLIIADCASQSTSFYIFVTFSSNRYKFQQNSINWKHYTIVSIKFIV